MQLTLKWIDSLCSWVWIISFLVLPWLVISFLRVPKQDALARRGLAYRPPFPLLPTILFVVPILMVAGLGSILAFSERNHALRFLRTAEATQVVRINGAVVDHPAEILSALSSLHVARAHHSHPTHQLTVEVVLPQETLRLILARDSDRPHEYWVYSPNYWSTSNNEIGRIVSPVFDSYSFMKPYQVTSPHWMRP